ncbi:hypothetical protein ACRVYI_10930 [Clostridioides difficile]
MCGNFILPRGEKSLWIFYSSVQLDFTINLAKRVNLFDYSLEELQAVHEYWRSMNRYSKQVLNKEKVA